MELNLLLPILDFVPVLLPVFYFTTCSEIVGWGTIPCLTCKAFKHMLNNYANLFQLLSLWFLLSLFWSYDGKQKPSEPKYLSASRAGTRPWISQFLFRLEHMTVSSVCSPLENFYLQKQKFWNLHKFVAAVSAVCSKDRWFGFFSYSGHASYISAKS